jgi:hypothetical protein
MPAMTGPTETSHEPTTDQLAHPAADPAQHPGEVRGEAHGSDDHGDTHGHDDHAHAAEALGPVDRAMWGALVLGVALGLLVAACIVVTLGLSPVIG